MRVRSYSAIALVIFSFVRASESVNTLEIRDIFRIAFQCGNDRVPIMRAHLKWIGHRPCRLRREIHRAPIPELRNIENRIINGW